MKVKDAMTKTPIVCTPGTPLREATALLRKHHIGGLPVIDGSDLVGMVTEADLISLLKSERRSDDPWLPSPFEVIEIPIRGYINWEKTKHALRNIDEMTVEKIMPRRVVTTGPDANVEEAAGIMILEGVERLPVLRGKEIVGIITRENIIHAIAAKGNGEE
jgi:CBS domain-containing protein